MFFKRESEAGRVLSEVSKRPGRQRMFERALMFRKIFLLPTRFRGLSSMKHLGAMTEDEEGKWPQQAS